MSENLKDQDILLVKEKDGNEVYKASMDKNGKVDGVSTKDSNNPDRAKKLPFYCH